MASSWKRWCFAPKTGIDRFAMRQSTFFQALPFQLLCMSIAAIVLAMIGPYGTYVDLPLPARLVYWALSMACGWFLMMGLAMAINRIEPLQAWPVAGRMALAGVLGGAPMAGIAWTIEALFRRPLPLAVVPELLMNTTVLTVVLAIAIGQLVELRLQARAGAAEITAPPSPMAEPPTPEPSPPPAAEPTGNFLRRLPPELGRDLLALEMEDHYARVHTMQGSTLILLRLRDAVAELGEGSGLQVHRSWWVARDAVADVERAAGKLTLVLRNELRVPVSKTYREAVRATGWDGPRGASRG
ncbi:LytTR family DNA-binding domain-containing protein [Vineibacter terrae]|uniref:LytTR family DNA-binding domain-containing protein n=1 Tax=Vineibacter terrae TaxID=2586908 RepID=UPI002E2F3412|nr:LytTR family DNA-binding domain-containing protein [Vineibacter terrae]HEX2885880.1 LytTR family DNA-binding domain-containing protein [Vineibacter terrae]